MARKNRARVEVRGLGSFGVRVQQVKGDARRAVRGVVANSTGNVEATARNRVPIADGDLLRSINQEYSDDGLRGLVRARARHAHLVEFGTVNMPAKPFLYPASEAEAPRYHAAMRAALSRATGRTI